MPGSRGGESASRTLGIRFNRESGHSCGVRNAQTPEAGAAGGRLVSLLWRKLKITLDMIRFEHTVFALPFALIGALLAERGLPSVRQLSWIVFAMVGARSAAMAFNRIADLELDRANPRTRDRALARGTLSQGFAAMFTIASSALFVFSAWQLNGLCFYLSVPVLGILLFYSYTKRFTPLSHCVTNPSPSRCGDASEGSFKKGSRGRRLTLSPTPRSEPPHNFPRILPSFAASNTKGIRVAGFFDRLIPPEEPE